MFHLCLQVHSFDRQLRNVPQGYGFLPFAHLNAGSAQHSIQTWRPAPSGRQQVQQWFVGGGPALQHVDFVTYPGHGWGAEFAGMGLNKMCTATEQAGTVRVRTACMVQYPDRCDLLNQPSAVMRNMAESPVMLCA